MAKISVLINELQHQNYHLKVVYGRAICTIFKMIRKLNPLGRYFGMWGEVWSLQVSRGDNMAQPKPKVILEPASKES